MNHKETNRNRFKNQCDQEKEERNPQDDIKSREINHPECRGSEGETVDYVKCLNVLGGDL